MTAAKRRFPISFSLIPMIFALAGPTMLEQLMHTAVQYIDTAMVGSLGTTATAAVGATTTVSWLVGSTINAMGIGFLAFIAQARGAGKHDLAKRAASQAVLGVIVLGVIFTVLPLALSGVIPVWMRVDESVRELSSKYFFILYTTMLFRVANIIFSTLLRAVGDTKTPMKVGIIVNVVNVVFNALLIYDPITVTLGGASVRLPFFAGMGVVGAALASAISYAVGGIIMTLVIYKHPEISPKGQSYKPCGEILIPCMKIAIPNAIQRFGTSLGYVAFASIVNSLGEVSTAAHTIANTVESAFYIPGYGMQTATATLVGNAYGAKDGKKIRELSAAILFLEVGMMIVSGGLLFAFAPNMVGIFSQDAAVIMLGAFVLRMVALSEPFYGVSIVLEGVMQGMGKTTFPLISNVIGMWAVRIVGTFVCVSMLGLGLISAWACMIAHNMMLFTVFLVYYLFGKWNPEREGQKPTVSEASFSE